MSTFLSHVTKMAVSSSFAHFYGFGDCFAHILCKMEVALITTTYIIEAHPSLLLLLHNSHYFFQSVSSFYSGGQYL